MAIQTLLIPIKIHCGCGQCYAFDVEPVAGRMPGTIACPVCGADGTGMANTILAESCQAQPPAAAPAAITIPAVAATRVSPAVGPAPTPSPQRVSVAAPARVATAVAAVASAPAATPPARSRLPGQVEPEQAKKEARSKIMWGDDPATVSSYLMSQGFNAEEARATIAPILAERALTVRKTGIHKIFTGLGMVLFPVVSWIIFMSVGFLPLKIFGLIAAVGVWGAFRALSGTLMVLSPKGEKGDVSEM